jgi:hypothetical protein
VKDNTKAFFALIKVKVCAEYNEQSRISKAGAGLAEAATALAFSSAELFAVVLVAAR